ncbi:endonuclease/exonuclease/phosphatase family protein [Streptomyces sp. NPDC021100]|uniref:endonuclease/exonuclease/phosphatase family protein n=1 Tax=Streptomyces sp. NPDC021100 TaxID=3365114 RepID=UPI0037B89998
MDASTIDVAVWNVKGGERRDLALDLLAERQPDVVLLQETTHGGDQGGRLLHAAEKRLKLRGFLSRPPFGVSTDIATAVYLRPGLFHVAEQGSGGTPWWSPPCHVQAQLGDCSVPLHFVAFHMCGFDADRRLGEAGWLTTLAHPGMATIAAGDTNSYPRRCEPVALPDWEKVTDRAYMVQRTYLDAHGGRRSDTRPDSALIDAGYVDLARHAADHLGLEGEGALAATAGFHLHDQGGPQRTDRGYAAGGVAAALEHVEVADTEDTRAASDHALLIFRFHRARLERVLAQTPYAQQAGAGRARPAATTGGRASRRPVLAHGPAPQERRGERAALTVLSARSLPVQGHHHPF